MAVSSSDQHRERHERAAARQGTVPPRRRSRRKAPKARSTHPAHAATLKRVRRNTSCGVGHEDDSGTERLQDRTGPSRASGGEGHDLRSARMPEAEQQSAPGHRPTITPIRTSGVTTTAATVDPLPPSQPDTSSWASRCIRLSAGADRGEHQAGHDGRRIDDAKRRGIGSRFLPRREWRGGMMTPIGYRRWPSRPQSEKRQGRAVVLQITWKPRRGSVGSQRLSRPPDGPTPRRPTPPPGRRAP